MERKICGLGFMFAFLATCLVAFTACSSDDDDNDSNSETLYATMTYSFKVNEELFSMADITVSYTDADDKTVTETISTTKWSKAVTKKCPCTFSDMTVTLTQKEGFEVEKDMYDVGMGYGYLIKSGTDVLWNFNVPLSSDYIQTDDLTRWFSENASYVYTFGRSVDVNGRLVSQ